VVDQHWLTRCGLDWPEVAVAIKNGDFGAHPLPQLARNFLFLQHLPVPAKSNTLAIVPPAGFPASYLVRASVKVYSDVSLLFSIEGITLSGCEFVFQPSDVDKISAGFTFSSGLTNLRLVATLHRTDSQISSTIIDSSATLLVDHFHCTREFLGKPLASINRFQVVPLARLYTKQFLNQGSTNERVTLLSLRFVNLDCHSTIWIKDTEDVLRILSSELSTTTEQQACVLANARLVNDTVFVVELRSQEESWCSHVGGINAASNAISSHNSRLPVGFHSKCIAIDTASRQMYLRLFSISKSTGAAALVCCVEPVIDDVATIAPATTTVRMHSESDQSQRLYKFKVESNEVLCENCCVLHRFMLHIGMSCSSEHRMEVEGQEECFRVRMTSFEIQFEARSNHCSHVIDNSCEFEECVSSLLRAVKFS
jgi:hypothetical protein